LTALVKLVKEICMKAIEDIDAERL